MGKVNCCVRKGKECDMSEEGETRVSQESMCSYHSRYELSELLKDNCRCIEDSSCELGISVFFSSS